MRVKQRLSAILVNLAPRPRGRILFAVHLIFYTYVWASKDWAWVQILPTGPESLSFQIWLWLNMPAAVATDLLTLSLSHLPLGGDGILYSVPLAWINAFGLAVVFTFASIQWLAVGHLVDRFTQKDT
jgi:hypothetical protein